MGNDIQTRKLKMATGALSHLIGAYYLLGGLVCNCDPQQDKDMRQILLHLKGIYWGVMSKKYGLKNPKRERPDMVTKELLDPKLRERGDQ